MIKIYTRREYIENKIKDLKLSIELDKREISTLEMVLDLKPDKKHVEKEPSFVQGKDVKY